MRKRKQISLMDGYSLKEKILNAAKTATKYITSINSDTGVRVHAADDTQNYTQVDADGMKVYKAGSEVASFGSTARVGPTNSGNALLDDNGMKVYKNGSEVAVFGSEARIGTEAGSNVLAGPNGIAVRDGLTELSKFGANGMQVGRDEEQHITITPSKFDVYDEDGNIPFTVQTEENRVTEDATWIAISSAGYTMAWNLILKGEVVDNEVKIGVGTSSDPTLTDSLILRGATEVSKTVNGVTVRLKQTQPNTIYALYRNDNSSDRYLKFRLTQEYRRSTTIINNRIMRPVFERVFTTDTTGTCSYAYAYKSGDVAQLYLEVYRGGSVSANGLVYVGKLLGCVPQNNVMLCGIFSTVNGTYFCSGYLSMSGDITVYSHANTSLTINSTHQLALYGTYIINEGSN